METKIENTNQNRIILEETFYVLSKKNCIFRVRLTQTGLYLVKESKSGSNEQLILLNDIIGCRCLRSKKHSKDCSCKSIPNVSQMKSAEECQEEFDDNDASAYLYIYAYVFQSSKGVFKKRERTIITLRFRSFDKYQDNYREAQKWRNTIKNLIFIGMPNLTASNFYPKESPREKRRLLIFCNPKSGAGKGKQIFQQKVVPVLQEAEIPYDLHMTKYANYAREYVRTSNLFQWTGIVVVGGDGIVFEVINGIFERWDWSEILKSIPVGVIPGGSGNGLARSIAHHCSEPYLPSSTLPSTLAAVKNKQANMDLVRVETKTQILFSFLSLGWGLLSDIDIESESLRLLGGQRFTIWSIARLIKLRSYGGKLWYLPASNSLPKTGEIVNTVSASGSSADLPSEVYLETEKGRQRIDSWYSANSRRSAYFSTTGSSYHSTPGSCGGDITKLSDVRMYGPASQIPCLPAPVPPTWKCIEGRFIMVHASYQSHLSEECLFAPQARLNDGKIWLLIVRAGASRSQLLQFLIGLSTGAHATENKDGGEGPVELVAVNAFRIEPDTNEGGYITVDGENVEYGPIQAEIFPGLGKVMVP